MSRSECLQYNALDGVLPYISFKMLKYLYDSIVGFKILRGASKVIALSEIEASQYKAMGVPEEKIAIIPNGIDSSEYAKLPPKGLFKRKFGISQNKRIVLYLGRVHKDKGISFLIKAFAYLKKKLHRNNVILVIAGPDDGYMSNAQSLVEYLGLPDSVMFTGMLTEREKISAFVDADVCVYPCFFEPFGIVSLESAATGTPVIVCKGTPMSKIVKEGKFGFSVSYGNVYELANAMDKILSDDALRDIMSNNGRRFVFKNFSWDRIVIEFEKVYKEVVA